MIEIVLPWPDKALSPNARLHWTKVSKIKKAARVYGYWTAREKKASFPEGDIPLTLTFYPPNKRPFDTDGLHSRCKAVLDGIADGWGVNDRRFRPVTLAWGDVVKNGRVVLRAGA